MSIPYRLLFLSFGSGGEFGLFSGAQGDISTMCSEVTPSYVQGTICVAKDLNQGCGDASTILC